MKNLLLFLAFGCLIGMSSCSSESDEEKLEGTWILRSLVYSDCLDPEDNEGEALSSVPCTITSADDCLYVEMAIVSGGAASFTVTQTFDGDVEVDLTGGTYAFDGDRFTLCIDGDCNTGTLTFSDGDDTVTMVFDEGTELDGCTFRIVAERK